MSSHQQQALKLAMVKPRDRPAVHLSSGGGVAAKHDISSPSPSGNFLVTGLIMITSSCSARSALSVSPVADIYARAPSLDSSELHAGEFVRGTRCLTPRFLGRS